MRSFFGPYVRGLLTGSVLSFSCCAVSLWYGALDDNKLGLADLNPPQLIDSDHSLEDVKQLEAARDILKYGVPDRGPVLRSYSGHVLAYDQARKIPVWVAEHLTPDSVVGPAHRKNSNFKPDPNVPALFSAVNKDYLNSGGWSRGHMSPAGDFKHSQASMDSTFYLTNVVPQNRENNGGYWNRFEIFCRDLTENFTDVRIFTGPVFLPNTFQDSKKFIQYEVIGENMVSAPTHLFKLVIAENNNSDTRAVGAFIMPNEPIGFHQKLTEFQVPVETLEESTGVLFTPLLNTSKTVDLCSDDSCQLLTKEKYDLHIFSKRLARAATKEKADKIWSEMKSKGLEPDSHIVKQYEDKHKSLEAKEKQKSEL